MNELMRDNILNPTSNEPLKLAQQAFLHLQDVLNLYMADHPNLTLNGLSKRCDVSEPTLRRIKKGQCKRIPNVGTVISLLSYVYKENDVKIIIKNIGDPLSSFLTEKTPISYIKDVTSIECPQDLGDSLEDPVKYLIYKLAGNPLGVSPDKVLELFGPYGEKQLEYLIKKELVEKKDDGNYHGKVEFFSLPNETVVPNFKATADFIKIDKISNATRELSPMVSNFSSGVNKKAYSELLKVQRAAQRKIAEILFNEKNKGDIPAFVLMATDTLDVKIAEEF